jgi:hypothetical protein
VRVRIVGEGALSLLRGTSAGDEVDELGRSKLLDSAGDDSTLSTNTDLVRSGIASFVGDGDLKCASAGEGVHNDCFVGECDRT